MTNTQEAVRLMRAQTFELLDTLRSNPAAADTDVSEVLVALQSVANQLGRIEALTSPHDVRVTEGGAERVRR